MLKLLKVAYTHPGRKSISNINIEFQKGKKYTIFGLKGSGKSTMVALLMKIIEPYEGAYLIDRKVSQLVSNQQLQQKITILRNELNLYHELTAMENLGYHLTLHNLEMSKKKMAGILEKHGIDNKRATVKVSKLTTQEQLRIAIAKSFLVPTEYIIIDLTLSVIKNNQIKQILRQQIAQLPKGTTCIWVTDDNLFTMEDTDENLLYEEDELYAMQNGQLLFVK
ncbi:MAG: ATP-binding cassette domain-containing protein [Culicoidibacterales bacterium]